MCILVSFYEVFPPGTYNEGGWVGTIPDGRGIRHYDEFYVCWIHDTHKIHANVVPNAGMIQIETECDDGDGDDDGDTWTEYDISRSGTTIVLQHRQFDVFISLQQRNIDGENLEHEPHTSPDSEEIYLYTVSNITVRE